MSGFDISPEMMTGVAADIRKRIAEWDMAVKEVYSKYAVLASQFEGQAKKRIDERMEADKPKYEALSALMSEYADVIVKAAKIYEEADRQAADAVRNA